MKKYINSERFLEKAERLIPLGSQTFSKSRVQYPHGVSPYFIEKGQGATVWDMDGNMYLDFVNSLSAITLGYCDPDVDASVLSQIKNGVTFSLPHKLEFEVAELIVNYVPCAEMVRFGKNGSDVTAAAIRLARAYTGKDHVLVCGYHGWQDWYIGATSRDLGVPEAVKTLTHQFIYNDIASLENLFSKFNGEVAAVIIEPMNKAFPKEGFLESVKALTQKNNAVLIFDEVITGFRFDKGGAQQYFNVTPDLATFGKGLANGYPLSAIVGCRDIMKLMEEIFFSFTFGGETLSLAASKAVLDKLERESVCEYLSTIGQRLKNNVKELVKHYDLSNYMSVEGHPSMSCLMLKDNMSTSRFVLQTYMLQEILNEGVLSLLSHNISYAHDLDDVKYLTHAYDKIFAKLAFSLKAGTLDEQLYCAPIEPVFSVR